MSYGWLFENSDDDISGDNHINLEHLPPELKQVAIMHEWSKLTKENADLYDYNHQVNRGWRGFILRLMGIHLPEKNRVCLYGINPRKESIYPD